ncbi:hypothetical protein BDN67DRAFT_976046 [Paxillus ammoniavirescens]|nr:hypothetical protein BDN67DRAFT_976046 [Paxillus ammoniavirescens]
MPETQLFRYTVPGLNGYDPIPLDSSSTGDPSMCSQLTLELAKKVDENVARRRERTGTWQFMSAMLLLWNSGMMHMLQDDIDSFLHVLVWASVKYVPATNAYSAADHGDDLRWLFDVIDYVEDCAAIGRKTKSAAFTGAQTTLTSPRTARNFQVTIQVTLHRKTTYGGREGAGGSRRRLD